MSREFSEEYYKQKRDELISELTNRYWGENIKDEKVLQAITDVPRHCFVAEDLQAQAYDNNPLSIGFGQTISQPYIIALMLELLNLKGDEISLEIGTGSGYQTALLCKLTKFVYSVERVEELAVDAEKILKNCSFSNFEILIADGSIGWKEKAPFDAIVVSAEMPSFPKELFEQLAEGGRIVAPVSKGAGTYLMLAEKIEGEAKITWSSGCRFVPLIGKEGYPEN